MIMNTKVAAILLEDGSLAMHAHSSGELWPLLFPTVYQANDYARKWVPEGRGVPISLTWDDEKALPAGKVVYPIPKESASGKKEGSRTRPAKR